MVILVVDDDAMTRFAMRRVLESDGHTVHEAADVAEARVEIDANHFDVAIIDWDLGRHRTGQDVWSYTRSGTYKIVMSGFTREHIRGPDPLEATHEFLQKPIDTAALRATLERVQNSLEATDPG